MADLELKLRTPDGVDVGGPVEILARFRRIGAAGERSVSVTLGGDSLVKDLEEGDYEVRLQMPSGLVESRRVRLDSATATLNIEADSPVDEILGWRTPSVRQRAEAAAVNTHSTPDPAGTSVLDDEGDNADRFAFSSNGPATSTLNLLMAEAPARLARPEPNPEAVLEIWRQLTDGAQGRIPPVPMIRGFLKQATKPNRHEPSRTSWAFGITTHDREDIRPPRRFAIMSSEAPTELASLPLPWRRSRAGRGWDDYHVVQLQHLRNRGRFDAHSRVVVHDSRYAGLISYLASGAVAQAGELVRAVAGPQPALMADGDRPLGECAAAYALVATDPLEDEAILTQWMRQIGRVLDDPLYSWIPDVHILAARLVLAAALSGEDAQDAMAHLRRALQLGLPFYSLGLSWLSEALILLRDDDLARQVAPLVDQIARRVDVSQAFVVLRLDRPD